MEPEKEHRNKGPSLLLSTRFGVALVGFLGCVIIYSQRVDLSVALVCMVNSTKIRDNITTSTRGEFNWDRSIQGYILGAFFWGYLCTQILGGWASQRFGAKIVMGSTVLIGSIITLLTPVLARAHFGILIAARVVLGFAQGVTFPGFHTLWSHWAPPLERSQLTGVNYAGAQIGNVITLPISGALCDHGFGGGWPSIFYLFGALGFLWVLLWYFAVADTPNQQKRISEAEKKYILESLINQVVSHDEKVSVPWKYVLTSMPVWAVIVVHFSADWGAYIMLTCLPSFMKDVLDFDMTKLGLVASVPYIVYFFAINFAGFLADYVRRKRILSTKNTRKAAMTIALGGQGAFLVAASYCGRGQETLVMILLTMGIGISGLSYAGFLINYMDIAPRFAGTVLGIGNTISCVCGILSPYAMGVLTQNNRPEEWALLFWLTFAILAAGTIFFDIFADGEPQPWALVSFGEDEGYIPAEGEKMLVLNVEDSKDHL